MEMVKDTIKVLAKFLKVTISLEDPFMNSLYRGSEDMNQEFIQKDIHYYYSIRTK